MARPTNLCAGGLGTVRSDVSQESRICNRRLFCDVRPDSDGGLSEHIRDVNEHKSYQQQSKVLHGQGREEGEASSGVGGVLSILMVFWNWGIVGSFGGSAGVVL